jgi:soluble calcium-activated nucleotidase 1
LGKEWTTTTGEYVNNHPMWIKIVSPDGAIQHVSWEREYKALRSAVGKNFYHISFNLAFKALNILAT